MYLEKQSHPPSLKQGQIKTKQNTVQYFLYKSHNLLIKQGWVNPRGHQGQGVGVQGRNSPKPKHCKT